MPITPNRSVFSFNHKDQVDEFGIATGDYQEVQRLFDTRAEENLVDINNIKNTLASTVDGDSGADNVKITPISGVTGLNVQEVLEYLATNVLGVLANKADKSNVIEKDSTAPYVPTSDYHPTNKKYVDGVDVLKADKANVIEKDSTAPYTPTTQYHPTNKGYVDDQIAQAVIGSISLIKATEQEAIEGTNDVKYMTPLKTKQAIAKFAPAIVKATQAEAESGTDDTKYMTPLTTKQAILKLSPSLEYKDVTNLNATTAGVITWNLPLTTDFTRTAIMLCRATKDISNFDYATCLADSDVTKNTLGKDVVTNTYTGLTNNTQYWVKCFVEYTIGGKQYYSNGVTVTFTTPAFSDFSIFGVAIDATNSNPNTALTYINDAQGLTPMSGNNGNFQWGGWQSIFNSLDIKPCLFKNGVVQYYLNPNDFNKKADGTNADITSGSDGDVMIEFGKPIYWKFSQVGSTRYVQWSLTKIDDEYKALAHTVGVTVRPKIRVAAYLGYYDGTKLRSLSGKTPTGNQTIGTFRTYAQTGGSGYQQMGYYPLTMLQVLYTVFFKSLDSQTALGRGYVDGNAGATNTGSTNAKGMFYGSTNGSEQMKFCGIEDFYGNCYYWIDGFFSDANRNMLISDQSVFNDTGTGYTNFGQSATGDINGYISDVQGGTETGFVVKATSGSASTYYCDYGRLYASRLPSFGGNWSNVSLTGAFQLNVEELASYLHPTVASRLMHIG